jgi:hypothetical protein
MAVDNVQVKKVGTAGSGWRQWTSSKPVPASPSSSSSFAGGGTSVTVDAEVSASVYSGGGSDGAGAVSSTCLVAAQYIHDGVIATALDGKVVTIALFKFAFYVAGLFSMFYAR